MSTPKAPPVPPPKQKQLLISSLLDRKIKQSDYLHKMYSEQINALKVEKQELEGRFERLEGFGGTWSHVDLGRSRGSDGGRGGKDFMRNYSMKVDQSIYINQSPTRPNPNPKHSTPIRQIHSLTPNSNQNSHTRNPSRTALPQSPTHPSSSPKKHYSKAQQLQQQIKQLLQKITARQQHLQSKQKQQPDQISNNLYKKVQQQEKLLVQELNRWKQLQININAKKYIQEKMQNMREEIFKQEQGIKTVKKQNVNRNKETVRFGYTERMVEVIASYGGKRQ